MIKIKKKLVLKWNVARRKLEYKDLTKIDQRSKNKKNFFEDCCELTIRRIRDGDSVYAIVLSLIPLSPMRSIS